MPFAKCLSGFAEVPYQVPPWSLPVAPRMPKNKPKEAYLVPAPKARLYPKVLIAKCLQGGAEGPYQGQPLSPRKSLKTYLVPGWKARLSARHVWKMQTLPRTFAEPFLERCVPVRTLRRAPKKVPPLQPYLTTLCTLFLTSFPPLHPCQGVLLSDRKLPSSWAGPQTTWSLQGLGVGEWSRGVVAPKTRNGGTRNQNQSTFAETPLNYKAPFCFLSNVSNPKSLPY